MLGNLDMHNVVLVGPFLAAFSVKTDWFLLVFPVRHQKNLANAARIDTRTRSRIAVPGTKSADSKPSGMESFSFSSQQV